MVLIMERTNLTSKDTENADTPVTVVDIGKHKRKQIRRLHKGQGKLMGKVQDALDQMRAEQLIDSNAHVVVLVVKEKRSKKSRFFP